MIQIINVFKMTGMPADEQEQSALIDKTFDVTNIHFHIDDEYYLLRTTTVKPPEDLAVHKLDPQNPDEKAIMDNLINELRNLLERDRSEVGSASASLHQAT